MAVTNMARRGSGRSCSWSSQAGNVQVITQVCQVGGKRTEGGKGRCEDLFFPQLKQEATTTTTVHSPSYLPPKTNEWKYFLKIFQINNIIIK